MVQVHSPPGISEQYGFSLGCAELEVMGSTVSKVRFGIVALALACMVNGAPRYIGVVSTDGRFWVDSAGVAEHASIFEGSIVETTDAPATVPIGNTVRVLLDASSRAQCYADYALRERGRGQLDSGPTYRLEARTLRVMPAVAKSHAVVGISDSGSVEVGALNGAVRVANADGVRVATSIPDTRSNSAWSSAGTLRS